MSKGFEAKDWGVGDVVCAGAHPAQAFFMDSIHTRTYTALLRTKDLIGNARDCGILQV